MIPSVANILQRIVNGEENPKTAPLGFCHPARGGPSHGHRQHAQKNFDKGRACGSGDILSDRQTERHKLTDRHTHIDVLITTHRRRSRGQSNNAKTSSRNELQQPSFEVAPTTLATLSANHEFLTACYLFTVSNPIPICLSTRSRSLYGIARPSVVCLSVVSNTRAPYSGG